MGKSSSPDKFIVATMAKQASQQQPVMVIMNPNATGSSGGGRHKKKLPPSYNNNNNNKNKCSCPPGGGLESGNFDKALMQLSKKSLQKTRRRVVYGILCFQLFIAAALISLFAFHEGIKSFLRTKAGKWLAGSVASIGVVLLVVVLFSKGVRRKTPLNLVMLGVLTVIFEIVIGGISTIYDPYVMSVSAVILVVIAIGLIGLALQTKVEELTVGQGVICCCLVVTFLFVALFNFIPLPTETELNLVKKIYACGGALTITMYFTGLLVALLPI